MSRWVSVRPEATDELLEERSWYEARAPGLGLEFTRAVQACIATVRRDPEAFPVVHRDVRRALLRRFPYGLYYRVEEDGIVLLACFHASRDPKDWRSRT